MKKIADNTVFRATTGGITQSLVVCLAGVLLLTNAVAANSVLSWGRQVLPPPGDLKDLMDVSAGDEFNLGLQLGGTVVGWGANSYGQATPPPDLHEVAEIAAGSTHALALQRDGTVVGWGNNRQEQAQPPQDLEQVVAISAGRKHSLALRSDGTVAAWGDNTHEQAQVPPELEDVVAISAGYFHNLALKRDGTVVGWGLDEDAQASVPEDVANIVAIAAGGAHSLALQRDGSLVAWGNNSFGQASFPRRVAGVERIQAGADHNLLMLEDGRTMIWGRNHYGQTSRPVDLPRARRIAAGAHHNVVLLENGEIAAWGNNDSGQSLNPADLTGVASLAARDNHTIALKKDGTVFWWGTTMATGLEPDPDELRDVVAVSAGRAHGLALRADGTVTGWGDNLYGQASPPSNLQNIVAIATGEFHSLALRRDGTVTAWGNNFQQQTNVPRGLRRVIAIAAGQNHSLAVSEGGMLFVWGDNFHGQRAVPDELKNVTSAAAGSFHNIALRNDGTIRAWGSDVFGQAAVPAGLSDIVKVYGGRSHSVAIRENRTIIAWGGNNFGQSRVPAELDGVLEAEAASGRTVVVTGEIEPPVFVRRMESRVIPAGEDFFLMPLLKGHGPHRYQWLKDGQPIEDATGPALSLRRLSAADSASYSLIVANPGGQTTSRPFSLEVKDPAVTLNVNPQVAMLGEEASFSARVRGTGPFQYQWKKDGEPIRDAVESVYLIERVEEEDTGIYTIDVSNEFATTVSAPVQFLVEPEIAEHPPETATARIGQRLVLEVDASGSRPLEIQWLRDGIPIPEGTGETLVLENVRVEDGGVYRAVVSNPAGRVASHETTLEIAPHIVFQPEEQVFSSFQGTAVFEVRATGTPPLNYHWMKDGQLLVRSADPRLVLDHVHAEDAGDYHVVVTNSAGRVESERASLILPPNLSRHPRSKTVRAGEAAEFTIQANGTRPFIFQWLKDGEPIPDQEEAQLKFDEVNGNHTGRYSVSVSNEVGTVTSKEGLLSVSPRIVAAPEGVAATPGESVRLRVEAEGSRPLYYQWTKDGTILPDEDDSSLTIDDVQGSDAGHYSVIVSNSAGIFVSDHAAVEVE